MDVAHNINITIKRIWRSFIRRALRPVTRGNKGRTPRERLEDLERISADATIAILLGILVEVGVLLSFHHTGALWTETILLIIGNLLIGLGLIVEYFAIRGTITATREDDRESDEKLTEAKTIAAQALERAAALEKEAAEARERTAEIEKLTAWRRITPEQYSSITKAIRDIIPEIDLIVECEYSDPESFVYARQIAWAFEQAGVTKIRAGANTILSPGVFGVSISAAPQTDLLSVIDAFAAADIELVSRDINLSRQFSHRPPAPNLYLFVAPKPPPAFDLPILPVRESSIDAAHIVSGRKT
jgi:hypothetical protein